MNNRTLINNELQSLAPALTNAPVAMPYTLPPHYFENLSVRMLALVDEESIAKNFSKQMPFTTPQGFFENFSDGVLKAAKAQENTPVAEEKDLTIAGLGKQMPFAVPEHYFATFPQAMLEKVMVNKRQSVPDGYFDTLPQLMLEKVRKMEEQKELEEIAPLLNTLSRENVFTVPEGYFEKLQPVMANTQKEAPVVSIGKKKSWLKYAAAACIAGMLSLGTYFLINNNQSEMPSIANQPTLNTINDQLASLDVNTIENYLQASTVAQPSISVAPLSSDELNKLNSADLDELLQDFTDQQLKKSIEESPELPTLSNQKKS